MKKFQNSDIFVNTIKAYPKVRIFTYSGSLYYNNGAVPNDGVKLFDFLITPGPEAPATAIVTEDGQYLLSEDGQFILIE
jgi:hypothetical protein